MGPWWSLFVSFSSLFWLEFWRAHFSRGELCSDFKVLRACLAGIPPLYHSFNRPYTCPISGPNRSFGLHIGGRPAEEFESRRISGGSGSLAAVVEIVPQADHPSPSGKGKGKTSEIRYPSGSEYLKAVVKYADIVGPSRIEPLYEKTFATCYRPLVGVQVCALIFSPPTLPRFQRRSASLKRPSRTVSTFLCTPLLRTSYNTSTFARPNFLPISGVFWSTFWLFLGTRASGFLA